MTDEQRLAEIVEVQRRLGDLLNDPLALARALVRTLEIRDGAERAPYSVLDTLREATGTGGTQGS